MAVFRCYAELSAPTQIRRHATCRNASSVLLLGIASLVLSPLSCSSPKGENVIRTSQAIQGGTEDEGDPAVVAILIDTAQGLSLCSGSLVAPNLVLTAHHCVANPPTNLVCGQVFGTTYAASSFTVTTSYDAAAQIFNSNNPVVPTPDGVTWFGVGSVTVAGTDICGQDLAALQLSSMIAGVCPLIPRVDVNATDGESYEAIGFGITSPHGQAAGTRYEVGGMVVQCVSDCDEPTEESPTEEWLGGSSDAKGTCEGDSGGPAIDSLGRVMGSVSRGPEAACNSTVYESYYGESAWIESVAATAATAGGYTAAGWVTGGATSDPANGYCASSTLDAGADSGASDAGAGTEGGGIVSGADAGADAATKGVEDAGATDAGGEDATAPSADAGGKSSGDEDAGNVGAGSEDAAVGEDASATASADGAAPAAGEDAGTSTADDAGASASSGTSSGCGCSVVGTDDARTGTGGTLGLALLGLVAVARRRRARRG
jgi:MYXO-CTERM domain-containing protein